MADEKPLEARAFKITNASKGPRFLHARNTIVTLAPGETRNNVELHKHEADNIKEMVLSGQFRVEDADTADREEVSQRHIGMKTLSDGWTDPASLKGLEHPGQETRGLGAGVVKADRVAPGGFGYFYGFAGDEKVTTRMSREEATQYATAQQIEFSDDPSRGSQPIRGPGGAPQPGA